MDYAFSSTRHDRAAHRRRDDAWRTDDVKVMVLGGEHVATREEGGVRWISRAEAPDGEWMFLGERDGEAFAAVVVDRVGAGLHPESLRVLGPTIAPEDASLAVHAVGLARWHQTNGFCSRCGTPTEIREAGHVRVCPSCGTHHFPRTDPAVIMLITDGDDRALLGRQGAWPANRYSTLAGFVEPGESLPDTVRREVMEEVGIEVGDVTYAGSQPWPFPSSLMLGFFGTALTHDITVDGAEIEEARWFTRAEMTEMSAASELLLPPIVSISRWLVQQWHGGEITGRW